MSWRRLDGGARVSVTYIRQRSYMKATGTHNDTATPTSDSGSAFIFTLVNVAPSGDHSEYLCPRTPDVPYCQDGPDLIGLAVIDILVLVRI